MQTRAKVSKSGSVIAVRLVVLFNDNVKPSFVMRVKLKAHTRDLNGSIIEGEREKKIKRKIEGRGICIVTS